MNYYEKYIKYKKKYVDLKNNLYMTGGDKPVVEILKKINLFNPESELSNYANPIFGFLFCETGFITNHYNFYDEDSESNDIISTFIHNVFYKIPGTNEIKPTKSLFEIKAKDIGLLLGFLYLKYVKYKDEIDKINKIIQSVDNLIKNIKISTKKYEHFLPIKKATDVCNIKSTFDRQILKHYKENFRNLTVIDIDFSAPEYANRYKNQSLLNSLICHKNQLSKIINEPTYSSEYVSKIIFKNINKEKITEDVFHVILAILWWISNDKKNIKHYYEGLNDILLPNMQVTIPTDFENNLFMPRDLYNTEPDSFEVALAMIYLKKVSSIKIIDYQYANTKYGSNFPDCGETSLRNFINIISYNPDENNFNIAKLQELNACENVINYYTVFNTINEQTSTDKKIIFEREMSARDAWANVVSNLPNVNYVHSYAGTTAYNYEINYGLNEDEIPVSNMLAVLRNLFHKIKNWSDFSTFLENFESELNARGIGNIHFKVNIGVFKWEFLLGHYHFEQEKLPLNINTQKLTSEQKSYVDIIMDHINYDSADILKKFYYIKFSEESLINFINRHIVNEMNKDDYLKIFNYMYNNYNTDQLRRIKINFDKINDMRDYALSLYNIDLEYDGSGKTNYTNVKSLRLNNGAESLDKFINLQSLTYSASESDEQLPSLDKLINLESLTFSEFNLKLGSRLNNLENLQNLTFESFFNQNLDNSLDKLTNLQNLTFGDWFNQNLNNSLDKLENLQCLTLGRKFNANLRTSLNNLHNLQSLTFGLSFNKSLGNSLHGLENLQNLTFGTNFNENLDNSLENLVKLVNLTFGNLFDQNLGNSLDNLHNLHSLTFGRSFNKSLVNSLDNLHNLHSLTFGHSFNKSLVNSLDKLTNLQNLTFENEFNQYLGNSLDNLHNLQSLTFGLSFNKSLDNSLHGLENLQNLTFGTNFNENLGNSLNNLHNLQSLTFDTKFNKSLNNSLNNLLNLKNLTFGAYFNQNLDNSLDKLTNLQNLTFGYDFNKNLEHSLDNLHNLQNLTFGNKFNQKLEKSLDNLHNLQNLTFGYNFNKNLEHSLDNLLNLQHLTFGGEFNQNLEKSLDNLHNLQNLTFGYKFNKNLEHSLDNLLNLQNLTFGAEFNQNLEHSLDKLVKMTNLTFGNFFNQKLNSSLKFLVNLESLIFGNEFNSELGSSLDKLTKLQSLTFGEKFDAKLNLSLVNLINLKNLTLSTGYRHPLGESLKNTIGLKISKSNY